MSKQHLSRKQSRVLEFIKDSIRTQGYPPSVREIGESVGLRSSSTVHGYLQRLQERGYIRRDPSKPRAIEVLDRVREKQEVVEVPLIGQITAGEPILAEENVEDYVPLPLELAPGDNTFLLKVRGDSMMNAGILDGDFVIVRQQPTAQDRDIVAALIEDEATVKTFYREDEGVRLQPENPLYEPIFVKDLIILGRVIGLFRRLN